MIVNKLLATIDRSIGSTVQNPAKPSLGRRFLLGGAATGLAIGGFSCLTEASVGGAAPQAAATPATTQAAPLPLFDHLRAAPNAADLRDWATFSARFIQPDGRVVDTYNLGVSHTESQGLGMLFAVAFDDRAAFDRIWTWTSRTLRRRTDALHAWRYVPGSANPVPDTNNATDGDIYIAAALVRASARWNAPAYLQAGQAIAHDIRTLLVREIGGRTILLPGASGFEQADHAVVNASYYVFPLIAELAAAAPSPVWARLLDDGRKLVAEAQFGQWRLPPDWLRVSARDGSLSLADRQPPRFSFDAVRIPLFLAWDRDGGPALARFAAFWGQDPARAPAWVDLKTGACAPYQTCGGVVAIAKVVTSGLQGQARTSLPAISANDDYYSAALILLSRLAVRETDLTLA